MLKRLVKLGVPKRRAAGTLAFMIVSGMLTPLLAQQPGDSVRIARSDSEIWLEGRLVSLPPPELVVRTSMRDSLISPSDFGKLKYWKPENLALNVTMAMLGGVSGAAISIALSENDTFVCSSCSVAGNLAIGAAIGAVGGLIIYAIIPGRWKESKLSSSDWGKSTGAAQRQQPRDAPLPSELRAEPQEISAGLPSFAVGRWIGSIEPPGCADCDTEIVLTLFQAPSVGAIVGTALYATSSSTCSYSVRLSSVSSDQFTVVQQLETGECSDRNRISLQRQGEKLVGNWQHADGRPWLTSTLERDVE